MDVKNTAEILDLAVKVIDGLAKAKAVDGKIDLKDLITLSVDNFSETMLAMQGVTDVRLELSELDMEETKLLLGKIVKIVEAIVGLVKVPNV